MSRMQGKARFDWERGLIARQTKSRQLVLRILLDYAGGQAECWPSNAAIGKIVGIKSRAVQLILRDLEKGSIIRCFTNKEVVSQRVIVFLGHPGTADSIKTHQPKVFIPMRKNPVSPHERKMYPSPAQAFSADPFSEENRKESPARLAAGTPPGDPELDVFMRRFFPWLYAAK